LTEVWFFGGSIVAELVFSNSLFLLCGIQKLIKF
jgi:hypothetical protein